MYRFDEDNLIKELKEYVDATYNGHYSKNKFQSTEFIIDCGHGLGFTLGNVLKYAQRYGHKDGTNRKDLLKILHYALIALYVHDYNQKNSSKEKTIQDLYNNIGRETGVTLEEFKQQLNNETRSENETK